MFSSATRGPNRTLPAFDVTGDIDIFFRKFEALIKNCKWPEHETLGRLVSDCLQGDATEILASLPSEFQLTYTNLKDKLYTFNGSRQYQNNFQQELQDISRKSSESLQLFCKRITVLVNKAYYFLHMNVNRMGWMLLFVAVILTMLTHRGPVTQYCGGSILCKNSIFFTMKEFPQI